MPYARPTPKRPRVTTEDDDDDEALCARFFHARKFPLLLELSSTGKSEPRLRLELDLYKTFRCVYLQSEVDTVFSIAPMIPDVGPYRCVAREVDFAHKHSVMGHRSKSMLQPLVSAEQAAYLRSLWPGPLRLARTIQQIEINGAVTRSSWILSHLHVQGAGASFAMAIAMVHRTALTLTRVAFDMRASALALAQHMRRHDLLTAEDVQPEHPLQPLSLRYQITHDVPSSLLVPMHAKSEARVAFEDAVVRVLDWRVARARDVYDATSEIMVSLTGAVGRLPCGDPTRASSAPGTVNLRRLSMCLVGEGRTAEAIAGAFIAAHGMEEAGHVLLRAVQRLHASGDPDAAVALMRHV